MESIKNFTIAVCLISGVVGVAGMLSPDGKLDKTFRLVLSLFCLIALLSAASTASKNINIDEISRTLSMDAAESNKSLSNEVLQEAAKLAESQIVGYIFDCAAQIDIIPSYVYVNIIIKDGSYELSSAHIILNNEDMHRQKELYEIISARLGISAEISAKTGDYIELE